MNREILSMQEISFSYSRKQPLLTDVSLKIEAGENLGIVGESGSGKSTLLKLLLGLQYPQSGVINFHGQPFRFDNKIEVRQFRQNVQAVFQDPYSSIDPRQRIMDVVAEPLRSLGLSQNHDGVWLETEVLTALESVGLDSSALNRYPHEFSGGQRQRIAIARAIISKPTLLLADEPVSSLDLRNRELILDLFAELQRKFNLTIGIVSHDISVVAKLCKRIIVMEKGQIVEEGLTSKVLGSPSHPYTKKLMAAIPRISISSAPKN